MIDFEMQSAMLVEHRSPTEILDAAISSFVTVPKRKKLPEAGLCIYVYNNIITNTITTTGIQYQHCRHC